ncbi:DUF6142 family protein [Anaerosporobacter sp.]|uniref:DUF6142 family protein n=1 Tax=Anaerosporobacter sp. TaxID=1872529 RepID=UPI00286F6770|nr:DUF6142 family protein [Anaerosporobacter sp.]
MKRKKKEEFKFSNKYHPLQGILGVIFAVIALIAIGVLFYISSKSSGNAGAWIGLVGGVVFAINIVGFILSILGFRKQEVYYRFPIIGILMNGCLFIMFLLLYIVGI